MERSIKEALDVVGAAYKELEKSVIAAIESGHKFDNDDDVFGYVYDDNDEDTNILEVRILSVEVRNGKLWADMGEYGRYPIVPTMVGNYQATLYNIALSIE